MPTDGYVTICRQILLSASLNTSAHIWFKHPVHASECNPMRWVMAEIIMLLGFLWFVFLDTLQKTFLRISGGKKKTIDNFWGHLRGKTFCVTVVIMKQEWSGWMSEKAKWYKNGHVPYKSTPVFMEWSADRCPIEAPPVYCSFLWSSFIR